MSAQAGAGLNPRCFLSLPARGDAPEPLDAGDLQPAVGGLEKGPQAVVPD